MYYRLVLLFMELGIIIRSFNLILKDGYLLRYLYFSSSVELPVHYRFRYPEPVQSGPHMHALFIFHFVQTPTQVVQRYEAPCCMLNTVFRDYYMSMIRSWMKLISRYVEGCFPFPQTQGRLWHPSRLLHRVCSSLFPQVYSSHDIRVLKYLHPMPALRMHGATLSFIHMTLWSSA